ncbi:hypothetical protein PRIPAC_88404 [Pristionchus pacificus]|uniref:Uncharacterized protein n=1 Tax=Pristionchus pacificus TaxID=54126 RepID=A0A2A6CX96_PRIPA|nr:hypothetical protein PRIPAC_88404 [Pristionchus pacificus]|eukprot:PDM82854.1 hypothetical protein PRIPAC_37247 [Pristionchus pacificus]
MINSIFLLILLVSFVECRVSFEKSEGLDDVDLRGTTSAAESFGNANNTILSSTWRQLPAEKTRGLQIHHLFSTPSKKDRSLVTVLSNTGQIHFKSFLGDYSARGAEGEPKKDGMGPRSGDDANSVRDFLGIKKPLAAKQCSTWRAVFRNMADDVIIFVNKVKGPSDPMSMVAGIENPGAMSGQWSLFSDPLS